MSNLKPTNLKAIGWYADNHNAVPQLSVYPVYRFKVRGTDEILDQNILSLTEEYKTAKKEEAKEKRRQQKAKDQEARR